MIKDQTTRAVSCTDAANGRELAQASRRASGSIAGRRPGRIDHVPAPRPGPCPVVDCTSGEPPHPTFVLTEVGSQGRPLRPVALCTPCWHRVGEGGVTADVEYRPPIRRWPALVRVTLRERA